jgi:hypothetical protein
MQLKRLKMPANKKPRKAKKYIPRTIPLTIRHSEETETALQLAPHAELMKLREGYGDEFSWNTIVARLNIGLVAANAAGKPDQAKEIRIGLDAMLKVQARFDKSGKWGLSGSDLRQVGDALVLTDNLQLSLTRKQFAQAIDYVWQHAAK